MFKNIIKKLKCKKGNFLFGGGGDEGQVGYEPTEIVGEKKDLKKLRSALFATEGGSAGEEIMSGGVERRQTIFGN